ncbi:hypothetical protein A3J90_00885 [candidate division WOR-1 bacterium RIFOXYC2_FULL_37_10]|uniref:Solute-binding protein family 5 domain-containing protein n=1 Tax=candidate division WOR-1 bacterium RIFOXYB2_FULL_37_13 TaxID=1802579 RepID=A0A1F4STR7_UNCSA|nr:MAG: hypothetical protein A2310_04390 [candidate division WOR-1 bacterium RIFOXYB2_FULL_37_13]OGC33264.1 MAG: hypothetical protein A3J90_00885 [candidate division WOR-1 bacterium RIFOXYC2_FULL_37_10]
MTNEGAIIFINRFILVLMALVVFSSIGFADYDPNGKLVFSLGGEVSVLNPILSTDSSSSAVEGVIFSGLTKINESLEVVPDMAKSWTVSSDGKIWTFYLRRDIKWHDGVHFTAEDVKFTFDSILNPKVNSIRRSSYIIDGKPIKFNVINKYTIQAILPKPFAPFLVSTGIGIIPKHLYEKGDINTSSYNRKPIGTGPFRFSKWKTGDYIEVVRNKDYYGGSPLLSSIIYRIIPDENATLIALESGQIDTAGIPPKDFARMKKVKGINLFEYDTLLYTYLGLNNDNPLFSDKRVRQALAYAVDKDQIISLVLKKLGSKAYSPSHPVSWAYSDDVSKFSYDTKKANDILKKAGWYFSKDGLRYKDRKRFEFTCLVNQGNKEREKAAIILQQQFKKVGVKMNIRVMEWAALLKILNSPTAPKKFDAIIMGWSLGLDPDGYSIWHSSMYPQGFNFIKYNNPEVDRLLEQGRTTIDKTSRKKIYAKLYKIISADQPYIFLWYPHSIIGVSDRVGGLSKPGPAGLFLNIEKVFMRDNK